MSVLYMQHAPVTVLETTSPVFEIHIACDAFGALQY